MKGTSFSYPPTHTLCTVVLVNDSSFGYYVNTHIHTESLYEENNQIVSQQSLTESSSTAQIRDAAVTDDAPN